MRKRGSWWSQWVYNDVAFTPLSRRWFVFDRNKRTLVYYADKSEVTKSLTILITTIIIVFIYQGKAKGGIYFHSISEVYVDHQKTQGASQKATFIMKTHDRLVVRTGQQLKSVGNKKNSSRKYSLTAASQEAMRIWVDVLFTGAEGYQEFQDLEWSLKTWSDLSRLGVIFQDLEWSFKTVPYFPRMVTKKSIRTYSFLPTRLHDVKKGLVDQDLQDL